METQEKDPIVAPQWIFGFYLPAMGKTNLQLKIPYYGKRPLPSKIPTCRQNHIDCQIFVESIGGPAWINVQQRELIRNPNF